MRRAEEEVLDSDEEEEECDGVESGGPHNNQDQYQGQKQQSKTSGSYFQQQEQKHVQDAKKITNEALFEATQLDFSWNNSDQHLSIVSATQVMHAPNFNTTSYTFGSASTDFLPEGSHGFFFPGDDMFVST